MFKFNIFILFVTVSCELSRPTAAATVAKTFALVENYPGSNELDHSSLSEISQENDFSGVRLARHIGGGGGGGVISGVGVFGGAGGGFASPAYAAPPLSVVSSIPVVTSVPVVTQVSSYPVYGGYGDYGGGYSGGFGGIGAGFGVAKFRVKGFGFGGGLFG